MLVDDESSALVQRAGFLPGQPVSFAAHGPGGALGSTAGRWAEHRPVLAGDLFYAASLTKQVTGAIVATLVASGTLDPDVAIPERFLPKWPLRPTTRQLLHHLGSLLAAGPLEAALIAEPWTNAGALAIAAQLDPPERPPGTAHVYSNIGYVLLGGIVEQATGRAFAEAAATLLPSLATGQMAFARDGHTPTSPQAPALGPSLPLSTGDGGLWTTAEGFAEFLDQQNLDTLGIAHLTQTDAVLTSGEAVGYGWGIGLRTFRGQALYAHAGSWAGTRARAARIPALGVSVVVLAAGHDDGPLARLTETLLARATSGSVGA